MSREAEGEVPPEESKEKPAPPIIDDLPPLLKENLGRVGGPVELFSVRLSINGEELVPSQITEALGKPPTRSRAKGDVVPDPKYHRTAPIGLWSLKSALDGDAPLSEHIETLLSTLTDDLEVWRNLSRQFHVRLFVGVGLEGWNRGLVVEPEVLEVLAERGIALDLDIYGQGPTPFEHLISD